MVAIKSHLADNFIKDPQEGTLAYLIYGTDEGRITENAALLGKNWLLKFGDGGELIRIDERNLAENPDLVAIEVRSVPMFGGRSVVRLTATSRIKPELIKELIELKPQNLMIVEAGNLKPGSALRKLFEKSQHAAAIACFPDEVRDIARLIDDELIAKGFELSPAARAMLVASLGADRGVSRQELVKLALYSNGKPQIEIEDILATIGDSSQLAYDQLISYIMAGDAKAALNKLDRLLASGQSCAGLTTVLARHLARLYKVRALIESGRNAMEAVSSLRPPVHFKQRDAMVQQARRLDPANIKKAIHLVQETVWRSRLQSELELTGTERLILILSRLAGARH